MNGERDGRRRGFIDGARWAIDQMSHPSMEEPVNKEPQTVDASLEPEMRALAIVADAIAARKGETQGAGALMCPRCGGVLRYAFSRQRVGRHRQAFTGRCDSNKCIAFSGH
jgi:hypothetical protein